jgi:hypothetical protein
MHNEHCHIVDHKKTGDSGMKNTGKRSDAGSRSSVNNNSGGSSYREVPGIMCLAVTELSPDMKGRRTRLALESSRPGSCHLASTRSYVRERRTVCPTVLTVENTKLLSFVLPRGPILSYKLRRRYLLFVSAQLTSYILTRCLRITTSTYINVKE